MEFEFARIKQASKKRSSRFHYNNNNSKNKNNNKNDDDDEDRFIHTGAQYDISYLVVNTYIRQSVSKCSLPCSCFCQALIEERKTAAWETNQTVIFCVLDMVSRFSFFPKNASQKSFDYPLIINLETKCYVTESSTQQFT